MYVNLSPLDWKIIHSLNHNARKRNHEITEELRVSPKTVKRRLDRLDLPCGVPLSRMNKNIINSCLSRQNPVESWVRIVGIPFIREDLNLAARSIVKNPSTGSETSQTKPTITIFNKTLLQQVQSTTPAANKKRLRFKNLSKEKLNARKL